mgnify:CR=1 FL=1
MNKEILDKLEARTASEILGAQLYPPEELPKKRKYTVTDKATRGQGIIPHRWKKGQSGNPKGRPVNALSLTARLNKKLTDHPEIADAVVNALIAEAKSRNIRAIEITFDRVDGKVPDTHKITGAFPIRIEFVPAEVLLREKASAQITDAEFTELPEVTP